MKPTITTDNVLERLTKACQDEIHKAYKNKILILTKENSTLKKMNTNLTKTVEKLEVKNDCFLEIEEEIEEVIKDLQEQLSCFDSKRLYKDAIQDLNYLQKRLKKKENK